LGKLEGNMEKKIKKILSCIDCGADYTIVHNVKNVIIYCPMCGDEVEEPEEDDGEFESNFASDEDE
jgi:ribosomal protein S27E